VRDTGCGIKDSMKPKMFKLFGTMGSASEANTHGIGLGLVISKSIVEANGGKLKFES
jgi:signal transduction histidine kinase